MGLFSFFKPGRTREKKHPKPPKPKKVRKKNQLEEITEKYCERLSLWRQIPAADSVRGSVGVLITPWLKTTAPIFNAECALRLAQEGWDVRLFCDFSNLFGNA